MKTDNPPDLKIRDARPEELDKVGLMMAEAYQQYEPIIGKKMWEGYRSDIINVRSRLAGSELIVAELDGEFVGAVTLYTDISHMDGGWPQGWAGIRLLAVSPKQRGKGIAHALMAECAKRAKKRGLTAIGLHTAEFMKDAKQMYENMGFVRVPKYDHHPVPKLTIMAYRLDI
jgi:GNAT superfamily N-acetyltransferase